MKKSNMYVLFASETFPTSAIMGDKSSICQGNLIDMKVFHVISCDEDHSLVFLKYPR